MNSPIIGAIVMAALQVTSPSFKNNDFMPSRYTCEGDNISPELKVDGIPQSAKSLAVTVFDPDAPNGGVVHWAQWNIQPSPIIPEKVMDGVMGENVRGKPGYTGPCPPSGVHHYHFMVYALDTMLSIPAGSTRSDLDNAMRGHILAQGELVGLYTKTKQ
ncbi:MAG TPA: YbhB/YbcL family Raf kinase inhibitor-like protein [Puia sp.]|nr:YbhB/YbcL family Raf kinase inhibitor-like protein [Puia sp.]